MMLSRKEKFYLLGIATVYFALFVLVYSAIYFHHHDSVYAEACPDQKTLLWCEKED